MYAYFPQHQPLIRGGGEPSAADYCDPYWDNVVLLMNFDAAPSNTTMVDKSPVGHTVTRQGTAVISSAAPVLSGGGSLALDGSGARLEIASSAHFGFGSSPWTWEARVRVGSFAGSSNPIFDFRVTQYTDGCLFIDTGSRKLRYWDGSDDPATMGGPTLVVGTIYDVCISYDGSTLYGFVDGVLAFSAERAVSFGSSRPLKIGTNWINTSDARFNGRLDELRITKGVCRYTADYAPRIPHHLRTQLVHLNGASDAGANYSVGHTLYGFDPSEVLELSLPAGMTYTAWSAWSAGSAEDIANKDWLNRFRVNADGVDTPYGNDSGESTGGYATQEDARAAFVPVTITGSSSYSFWLSDLESSNNRGGLSIRVESITCGVSEPPGSSPQPPTEPTTFSVGDGDNLNAQVGVVVPSTQLVALSSTGTTPDVSVLQAQNLPPGLTLSLAWNYPTEPGAGTLSIAGTPTTAGTYNLLVSYIDDTTGTTLGSSFHQIVVSEGAPAPAPAPSPAPPPPIPGSDPYLAQTIVLLHGELADATATTTGGSGATASWMGAASGTFVAPYPIASIEWVTFTGSYGGDGGSDFAAYPGPTAPASQWSGGLPAINPMAMSFSGRTITYPPPPNGSYASEWWGITYTWAQTTITAWKNERGGTFANVGGTDGALLYGASSIALASGAQYLYSDAPAAWDASGTSLTVEAFARLDAGHTILASLSAFQLGSFMRTFCPLVYCVNPGGELVWALGYGAWVETSPNGVPSKIVRQVFVSGTRSTQRAAPNDPLTVLGPQMAPRGDWWQHLAGGIERGADVKFAAWLAGWRGTVGSHVLPGTGVPLKSGARIYVGGTFCPAILPSMTSEPSFSRIVPFTGLVDEVRITLASRYAQSETIIVNGPFPNY